MTKLPIECRETDTGAVWVKEFTLEPGDYRLEALPCNGKTSPAIAQFISSFNNMPVFTIEKIETRKLGGGIGLAKHG